MCQKDVLAQLIPMGLILSSCLPLTTGGDEGTERLTIHLSSVRG